MAGDVGRAAAKKREDEAFRRPTSSGSTNPKEDKNKGPAAAATASGTNRGAVERMDRLDRERPELAEKVKTGEMKPTEAMRQMKKDAVAEKAAALPADQYRVIYADPP